VRKLRKNLKESDVKKANTNNIQGAIRLRSETKKLEAQAGLSDEIPQSENSATHLFR
jgi:hypothetical protein